MNSKEKADNRKKCVEVVPSDGQVIIRNFGEPDEEPKALLGCFFGASLGTGSACSSCDSSKEGGSRQGKR